MADELPLSDEERAELVAYLDGELDEQTARSVEALLGRDARARAEAEALRRTWNLLDYLPRPEPSGDFTNRTMERLAVSRPAAGHWPLRGRWRPWSVGVGWAAAVLLTGSLGYAGGTRLARGVRP